MATTTEKRTMTKKKLVNLISQDTGIHPKDVHHVVQEFLNKVTHCLSKGERLEFRDFGVLEVVVRREKIGRNPKKPKIPIKIPRGLREKFTAGKKMRRLIEAKTPGEEIPKEEASFSS